MTLHTLALLMAIMEHRSFKRAAEALKVSQPAISTQIKALEAELGCTLFRRQPGTANVEPTQAGELVYRAALRIFETLDLLEEELNELRNPSPTRRPPLRVICDLALGIYTLPRLLRALPDNTWLARVILNPASEDVLAMLLSAYDYDLAIVFGEMPTPDAVTEFIFTEELAIVANPKLVSHHPPPHLVLTSLPLAIPAKGAMLHRLISSYFRSLNVKPTIVMQSGHPEATKALARTEPVAAITHRSSVLEELEAGTLVELRPPRPLPQLIYKVVRPSSRLEHNTRAFIRCLQEHLVGQSGRLPSDRLQTENLSS
ncbi:MAG: LysR family transcriptional regulator [Moorellales bacterium]